jgi:hypothetical protein
METSLYTIVIFAAAFFGSQLLLKALSGKSSNKIITLLGGEFILLGLLAGPKVTGLISQQVLQQLEPILALGIGWAGFLFGSQLNLGDLKRFPTFYFKVVASQGIFSWLLLMTGLMALSAYLIPEGPLYTPFLLAVIGSVSSPMVFSVAPWLQKKFPSGWRLLYLTTSLDAAPALVIYGVFFAFLHIFSNPDITLHTHALWLALSLGLALIFGYLFRFLIRLRLSKNELLLVLLATVIFASGSALYLHFSPLLINFIIGIITANTQEKRTQILELLMHHEKNFYLFFLLLAGALWRIPGQPFIWLSLAYLLLRVVAKLTGFALARRLAIPKEQPAAGKLPMGGMWLLSQGGMALAMAIDFDISFAYLQPTLILHTVLLSIILFNLLAPLIQHWLKEKT